MGAFWFVWTLTPLIVSTSKRPSILAAIPAGSSMENPAGHQKCRPPRAGPIVGSVQLWQTRSER